LNSPEQHIKHIGYLLLSATLLLAILFVQPLSAQELNQKKLDGPSSDKVTYKPGSAWTLSSPLGTHIASTVDTLLYNYQRTFVTALTSDAYATTGQYSGPGINMLYFQREESSPLIYNNALSHWIPTYAKQKFYNMYIPFTQLSYNWGFGTNNRTDQLKATFAGNVNRKIGIGAWVDYPYTKGSYDEQASKELGYGISGYYTGDRYEMQAFYNHWNHINKENGGITDDRYITDPAEIQGGVNEVQTKSIPTRLSDAHNRVTGNEFFMSHAYKLGYWRDITQPTDTVKREEFVASTKLIYTFDWKKSHHLFIDTGDSSDFWENSYFNSGSTRDENSYWSITNTVGAQMNEGFQKWAKFSLLVYGSYEIDQYNYNSLGIEDYVADENSSLTALPNGTIPALKKTRNRLWVGGRIEKTRGKILRYAADAKFGLIGDAIGEVDVRGEIETHFKLGKDTVRIAADGFFKNLAPDYMLQHYVGNHFIWDNNFGMTRSFRAEGRLDIPWTRTELRVGVENIQNQIYFNSSSLPEQYGGNVQVFSASIDQKLRFGIWNWNNTVTYQVSSEKDVIPLPSLTVYSNMFLRFKAFKHLEVQVGVDCNWYSKYKGYAYQPATMAFCSQGADGVDVGNFIFSDAYLTAKLYKVRFFVMCSNLSQGWFDSNYFTLPHYPLDPRQIRIGLSVDFAN
jgi:hypothetical protein